MHIVSSAMKTPVCDGGFAKSCFTPQGAGTAAMSGDVPVIVVAFVKESYEVATITL